MGRLEVTHLLDTHAWIQRTAGESLPPLAEKTMREHASGLAIADISIWEAVKLVELNRIELSVSLEEFLEAAISPELTVLPITAGIARRVITLEASGFHKDPADQLIVATALEHGLKLISNDTRIRQWGGVPMLWKSSRD